MATGDQYVDVQQKRIMGVQDFRERMIEYIRGLVKDIHDVAFGLDGVFGGVPITMSAGGHGNDRFQLDLDATCSDADGHFLITDAELAGRDVGIKFENTSAQVYTVGLHFETRPRGVQINPRLGRPEFIANEESIGNKDEPTSVVNNLDGTMTFVVDSVTDPFGTTVRSYDGRKCLVWKKLPGTTATTEELAIEECLITWSGSQNTITTSLPGVGGAGTFGQSTTTASETASDYLVMVLGPTITRQAETDLQVEPTYTFIGSITGNGPSATPGSFDTSQQNDLSSGFAVDLNEVTRLDVHGDLKIRVQADSLDSNEPQIEVQNFSGTPVFIVDETGQITAAALAAAPASFQAGTPTFLSADGTNLAVGDPTFFEVDDINGMTLGNYWGIDPATGFFFGTTPEFQVDDIGRTGIGGAADAARILKTHGLLPAEVESSLVLGQGLTDDGIASSMNNPRIDFGTNALNQALALITGGFSDWKIYREADRIWFTYNIAFDGTTFDKIDTGVQSFAFCWDNFSRIVFVERAAGAGTWSKSLSRANADWQRYHEYEMTGSIKNLYLDMEDTEIHFYDDVDTSGTYLTYSGTYLGGSLYFDGAITALDMEVYGNTFNAASVNLTEFGTAIGYDSLTLFGQLDLRHSLVTDTAVNITMGNFGIFESGLNGEIRTSAKTRYFSNWVAAGMIDTEFAGAANKGEATWDISVSHSSPAQNLNGQFQKNNVETMGVIVPIQLPDKATIVGGYWVSPQGGSVTAPEYIRAAVVRYEQDGIASSPESLHPSGTLSYDEFTGSLSDRHTISVIGSGAIRTVDNENYTYGIWIGMSSNTTINFAGCGIQVEMYDFGPDT